MSAATAKQHTPAELHYHGTGANGVAVFSSASKSKPGARNWTYVDTAARIVACECQAKAGSCWHCDLALTALAMAEVAGFVASLSDAALLEVGTKAAAAVEANRHTAVDIAILWQSRVEFCRRRRAAVAAPAPAPARRSPKPCPDCGQATTEPYICRACMADLDAYRAEVAAREAAERTAA